MYATYALYGAFARNAFLKMLAYRLRYYTGIFTYLLFVSVHYFIWQAIFDGHEEGARINGFTLTEMVTYISIGWISRTFYYSTIDHDIDDMVRTGQISTYLIRPVNFQFVMLSQAVGEALFRVCLFSVPVGAAVLIFFPIAPPAGIESGLLFFFAIVIGFFILAEVNFLIGMLAFSFKSIQGLIRGKYYVIQLCSGLLLPLAFFPEVVRKFLELLPFIMVAHVPLQFYLGKTTPDEYLSIFLTQAFWVIVLFMAGQYLWRRGMRKLTLQGG